MRKGYVWWCVDLELDGAGTGDGALEVERRGQGMGQGRGTRGKLDAERRKRGGVERQRGLRTELRGELCGPKN